MVNQRNGDPDEKKPEAEETQAKSAGEEVGGTEDRDSGLSPSGRPGPGEDKEAEAEGREKERGEEEGEDFGAMFEESQKQRERDDGELIHGVVVSIHKEHVMVDIGSKSEGAVSLAEFRNAAGEVVVSVGQELDVLVDHRDEDSGMLHLSKDKAEKRRVWEDLESAFKTERPVRGKVIEKIKGGLIVDIGIQAFLPGSQADVKPVRNLEKFLGLEDSFQIIKFNRKRSNVVVSRRNVMEKDRGEKRSKTLAHLEKDQIVKGLVKNLTEYGAFLDLGGIDGLLHITDMSHGRIGHPSEIIKVGDELSVKVLRFNRETEKVSLGLKQILPDPWDNVEKKYPLGTIVTGKVVSVTDYGAFVELERGVEGLVHVSEMTWSKKRVHPGKVLTADQEIEAKVLNIDPLNRRISLSLRQAQPNPWDMLEVKYPVGTRIRGKVRNITTFGAFVGVEDGIDGLVHISDLSWTKRVKHPSEILKKGEDVDCVVLKIDKDNERFSLGLKQALPDPWESVLEKYRPGMDVEGKVVNITDFGVFVELEEGIEGLIHISELSHEKVKDPTEFVQPGQKINAEILNVDISERKIRLSIKALERAEEQAAFQKYRKQEGDGTSKLGELIQDKLKQIRMTDLPGVPAAGDVEMDKGPPRKEPGKPVEEKSEAPADVAAPEASSREPEPAAEIAPEPDSAPKEGEGGAGPEESETGS